MNRKTLYALATFAGLGILAVIALTRPQKGERASDHPSPVATINAADVETIEVTKGGATTTIKNDGGKYAVTAPVAYTADEAVAKAAFEGLGKMNVSDLVTEQKGKQAEFEVDDKSGIHVVAKAKGGKVLADLIVGKSTGRRDDGPPDRQGRGLAGHRDLALPLRQVARRLARQEHHHLHGRRRREDRGRDQGRRQDDRQEDRRQGRLG